MIMASVIVLGALTAADARAPASLSAILIAAFGLAHGFAHGSEAPAGPSLGFPLGFALSTASLHLIGLTAGLALNRFNRPAVTRLLGATAVIGGLALMVAG
jgi:urease accessory protein